MSQDSCDDENEDPVLPSVSSNTPGKREATAIGQKQEQPSNPPFYKRLKFWNVAFNFVLVVTTAFLGCIAFSQLESSRLEQRAWIGFKEMKMMTLAPIRVDFKLMNSGKTPALDVVLAVNVSLRVDCPMDELTNPTKRNHAVIFPGSDTYEIIQVGGSPSQEELNSINTGQKVLCVIGEIEYIDVFSKPHRTPLCGLYRPEQNVFYSCNEHKRAS